MSQVAISAPDGTVMFYCKGGEAAKVNLPDAPSEKAIEVYRVPPTTVPPSYAAVQSQMDNLHTQTMDFFSKWLKTGNAGGNANVSGSTSVLMPDLPKVEEEADEDDGGQLDLDTEGGAMNIPDEKKGQRLAGGKAGRA